MSFIILWSIKIILFGIFALCVFYIMTRNKHRISKICGILFTISASMGFIFYSYSYLSSGTGLIDIPLAVLRGILSAARMFVISADYELFAAAVGVQYIEKNIWLQILFWIPHVMALIVIQATLISLFGQKLMDYFRLSIGCYKEVYIIKGSDKYALILGENISTHDATRQNPDSNRLIIFLIGEDDDAKNITERVSHFRGIVQVLDKNHNLKYYLAKAKLGKFTGRGKKYKVILMSNSESVPDDAYLVAQYAKENKVAPKSLDIYAFCSSEWDKEEIEKITLNDEAKCFYPYTFHIINDVDLLIRLMIKKHQPFDCPNLILNGKATRDFTVMILGFGKVGQNALLRLIMNGQFVGSQMRAIVVDKNIDNLRDCFLHRYPTLKICCNIEYKNLDVQCDKFFKLLKETKELDYVIVALNNNIINKQTALDICLHYGRNEKNVLPFIAVYEENGCLHMEKKDEKVFIFGCREEIYTDEIIIREENDRMAKAVHETYRKMGYGDKLWRELDWVLQESNRAVADFIPAMLKLADIDEKDAIGKKELTENSTLAEILAQTEKLRWNAFHAAMGFRPISVKEMRRRFDETQDLEFSRRCSKSKLQVTLVPWEKIDEVSKAYRELEKRAGREPKRDFKNNDRDIIKNIPEFLREAKKSTNDKQSCCN